MTYRIISLLTFLGGFLWYFFTFTPDFNDTLYTFDYEELKSFNTGFLFLDIFFNNIVLGIILSIFGYLSGGIVTITLLFYNGYLLGIFYKAGVLLLSSYEIFISSLHIPTEIFAFVLFSEFGLKGFKFYRTFLVKKQIEYSTFFEFKKLIFPTVLLFISAFIEII